MKRSHLRSNSYNIIVLVVFYIYLWLQFLLSFKFVDSIPIHVKVYSIQLCVIKCICNVRQVDDQGCVPLSYSESARFLINDLSQDSFGKISTTDATTEAGYAYPRSITPGVSPSDVCADRVAQSFVICVVFCGLRFFFFFFCEGGLFQFWLLHFCFCLHESFWTSPSVSLNIFPSC